MILPVPISPNSTYVLVELDCIWLPFTLRNRLWCVLNLEIKDQLRKLAKEKHDEIDDEKIV